MSRPDRVKGNTTIRNLWIPSPRMGVPLRLGLGKWGG